MKCSVRTGLLLPTRLPKCDGTDEHLLLAGAGSIRMNKGVGTSFALLAIILIRHHPIL